ncbi:MAG: DUF3750 domain-containing protein [Gammaproteobacteria bacterium]
MLLAVLAGPVLVGVGGAVDLDADWRTASRAPAGIAPEPRATPEAVVQVYAARAFNWRGLFAVHAWIATKRAGARAFTVHQVLGWNKWYGRPVVDSRVDVPDRAWYGAPPELVADVRGAAAADLIAPIEQAVARYPYRDDYRVWPGPNSNTFVAFVAREVPALGLALPATAIGKDYLPGGALTAAAPSGTGVQLSLGGVLGVLAAKREGLELNVLGLVFGIDPLRPALKLPGIGRVGLSRAP